MQVKVGDIRINERQRSAVGEILKSGRLSEGPYVREFETRFSDFCGTKYAIATSSGSAAITCLLAVLVRLGMVKPGQEVLTSPLTYIATASSVLAAGLEPIFADVDLKKFWIRPDDARQVLSTHRDCRVLFPVHLMGYPAPMRALQEVADDHSLIMLEDASQAHGSRYLGRRVGSIGLAGTFSFYIAHNIQAGEMGIVTTNSEIIDRFVRKLKAQGRRCACRICTRGEGTCPELRKQDGLDPRFTHDLIGFNFKTTEIPAAIALDQLDHIEEIIEKRQDNVRFLNAALIPYENDLRLPFPANDRISYLAYPIVVKSGSRFTRTEICNALEARGIETRPLFGCIPTQQPAFAHLKHYYEEKLPNAEYLGLNGFYIGCHQYLTRPDLVQVASAFESIFG